MSLKIIVSFQLLAVKIAIRQQKFGGNVKSAGCSGAGSSGPAIWPKHTPALGHPWAEQFLRFPEGFQDR